MPIKNRRLGSYALITANGKALLSLLNRGPNKGKWNLIGGAIEHGETPLEALCREIKEEADIFISPNETRLLSVLSRRHLFKNSENEDEDLQVIGVIYHISLAENLICKEDGDGESSLGCKWIDMDELSPTNTVSFIHEAIKLIG